MKLCSICHCQFILSKSMKFPFSCFSFIDYAEHLLDLNLVLHIVRYKQIICLFVFHILLQKLDQCEVCSVECDVPKSWDTKQCLVLIFWELSTIKFNIEFELCDVWAKLVTFSIVEIWNLYFWCLTLFTSEWVCLWLIVGSIDLRGLTLSLTAIVSCLIVSLTSVSSELSVSGWDSLLFIININIHEVCIVSAFSVSWCWSNSTALISLSFHLTLMYSSIDAYDLIDEVLKLIRSIWPENLILDCFFQFSVEHTVQKWIFSFH